LVIGFVFLVFSGKDTRCNYFPNARGFEWFKNNSITPIKASFGWKWIDTADIKNTLQFGDVDLKVISI
jgi:hypothetical protein